MEVGFVQYSLVCASSGYSTHHAHIVLVDKQSFHKPLIELLLFLLLLATRSAAALHLFPRLSPDSFVPFRKSSPTEQNMSPVHNVFDYQAIGLR